MLKTLVRVVTLIGLLTTTTLAQPLTPLPGRAAPELTEVVKVTMVTDLGELKIEVYPQAAPGAAERFLELIRLGFFDNTPIFRVVKKPEPFVAQFGINSQFADWREKRFADDPSLFSMARGTLAFAKAGPDTNSTQIFLNYRENNQLTTPDRNFSAFARVVSGMDIADRFEAVGDDSMGLPQDRLWADTSWAATLNPGPTMIRSVVIGAP